eukprot:Skav203018  [mRNA]  locus=scaffold583:201654:205201:+ [translate_table: standard]
MSEPKPQRGSSTVLVATAVSLCSAGVVGAALYWWRIQQLKAKKAVTEAAVPLSDVAPPVVVEVEQKLPEEPLEDIQVDFCVEGELQQCEHTLGVVQCLRAERGSSKNAALDTALGALDELVPVYAKKMQDKRWLASHAAQLDSTSEALQLLLLADDEQNLEAAAKAGRDIPELMS